MLNPFKSELENFVPPEEFQWSLSDPEECHPWYIAVRCFEDFRVAHGRCPGQEIDEKTGAAVYPESVNADDVTWLANKGKEYVAKIPGMSDDSPGIDEKYFYELVRFSDTQVHTISAFLGGVASQEAIKIIIKQYTIFNDTFIYDGIHGRSQVYKLED
jgi:amyloid beta precursor protein binding protein 1